MTRRIWALLRPSRGRLVAVSLLLVLTTAAALAGSALPASAFAQAAWPTRNIRAMVPFGAGSSIDIVGRIVLDPPPTSDTADAPWCGDRNGGRRTSPPGGSASPAAEWMHVTSSASSGVRSGSRPARRRARISSTW